MDLLSDIERAMHRELQQQHDDKDNEPTEDDLQNKDAIESCQLTRKCLNFMVNIIIIIEASLQLCIAHQCRRMSWDWLSGDRTMTGCQTLAQQVDVHVANATTLCHYQNCHHT